MSLLEALFSLWGGQCFLEAGFKLGVRSDEWERNWSCLLLDLKSLWGNWTWGRGPVQRHVSFKDAKCSLHHVDRPSSIPSPPHCVPIPTSQLPHTSHLFGLLVLPSLSFLSVPTTHLWSVVRHNSRIWAEPWWRCSLPGWVRRGCNRVEEPACSWNQKMIDWGDSKQIGRTHKHSLDQENTGLPKIKRDASSNYS